MGFNTVRLVKTLGRFVEASGEAYQHHQAQQGDGRRGRRRRRRKSDEGCNICDAMDNVDSARERVREGQL